MMLAAGYITRHRAGGASIGSRWKRSKTCGKKSATRIALGTVRRKSCSVAWAALSGWYHPVRAAISRACYVRQTPRVAISRAGATTLWELIAQRRGRRVSAGRHLNDHREARGGSTRSKIEKECRL